MAAQWLWIPERMASRNELDSMRGKVRTVFSRKSGRRVRCNAYSDFKSRFHGRVALYCKQQKMEPAPVPAFFTYVFFEPDRKRDPSNFTGSGQKLVEDALTACGVLDGDGWRHVRGFCHFWLQEPRATRVGLAVCIGEERMDEADALTAAVQARGAWVSRFGTAHRASPP